MLVDSDVLIWYLRGNTNAVQFLNDLVELDELVNQLLKREIEIMEVQD